MTTKARSARGFDPRALPIAIKLAIVLAVVLLVSGIVTDRVVQGVVSSAQEQVVLQDLETLSRSNAFRMVDVLGQEVISLSRFGASPLVHDQLKFILSMQQTAIPTIAPDGLLNQQVVNFRQTNAEFDAIAVLDLDGKVRAIDPMPTTAITHDLSRELWFTGAYNNGEGGTYIASPEADHLTGLTGIHIAMPIYDNENPTQILGVLYGIWNMSNILDITEVGAGREGLVLEPDGTILISPTDDQGRSLPRDIVENFTSSESGSFGYPNADDPEVLFGYVTLPSLGLGDSSVSNLRWTVVVRQPASAVAANVAALTNNLRVAISLSAVGVTIVAGLFLSLLLRPVRRLTAAATSLEEGNLNTPIPDLPKDEIGQLADVMRGLVDRLLGRVTELRAAVQISHATALTFDIDQMLGDVARTLTTQLDYPDVRIYLTDANARRAYIQAAAGGEGERLLRTGHRIMVDESTLVGRAILLGEPQIGSQREQLREAGLMKGRSELAIPLLSANRALGAIHVLARRLGEFEPEDVDILRLIADQLAASIANARLFEQSQQSLTEIEALNRRLTREAWQEYLETGGALRHTADPDQQWPTALDTVRYAPEMRAETLVDADGRSVLAVPLILRGEPVGTLAVTRPAGERWTRDEISLLESIASRMSMIAEGIRLVDESNRRALREQRVNEVSANLLGRASSVESVLRNALSELGGALGSDRVSLRLGAAPSDGERAPDSDSFKVRGADRPSRSSERSTDLDDNGHHRPNGDGE